MKKIKNLPIQEKAINVIPELIRNNYVKYF